MIRRLFLSLLTDGVALLAASAILPFASFWLCHSSIGSQIVFWVGLWTMAVWTLLIVQLGGSRFWKAGHTCWRGVLRTPAISAPSPGAPLGRSLGCSFLTPPSLSSSFCCRPLQLPCTFVSCSRG